MTAQGYLLDTDYVVDFLKGREYTSAFLEKVHALQGTSDPQNRFEGSLDISIITYAEVYAGILNAYHPKQQEQAFLAFIKFKNVYGISRPIAKRYAVLRNALARRGELIDQPDLFIAATAIHHHLTLVTRNRKDFARIPDLKLYTAS